MRSIVEETEVSEAVDDARERWARADDAWNAVTWALMRDPAVGVPLSETGKARALTFDGARSIDMPTIMVVYEFDAQFVTIKSARFEDAAATHAGRA
jgi:hypothetical protein